MWWKKTWFLSFFCSHVDTGSISKWNESGFRPPLCTYRLNWTRRTFWGWWDEWDDTALQTQNSKFEPWLSGAEHATSRSRGFVTIKYWIFSVSGEETFCFFQIWRPDWASNSRLPLSKQAASTTALGPRPVWWNKKNYLRLRFVFISTLVQLRPRSGWMCRFCWVSGVVCVTFYQYYRILSVVNWVISGA